MLTPRVPFFSLQSDLVLSLRNYSKSLNAKGHLEPKEPGSGPPTPQHATSAPAPAPAPANAGASARGRKRKQARPSSALYSYDAPGRSDEEDPEGYAASLPPPARRGGGRQRPPVPTSPMSPAPPVMPLFRTRQQTAAACAGGSGAAPGLPPIPPLARPVATLPAVYALPPALLPAVPQFGWGGFPAALVGGARPQHPVAWTPDLLRAMQLHGLFLQQLQQLQQQQAGSGGAGAQPNDLNQPGSGGSGGQV